MLVSTTVKFRAGSPKLKFLVLAIEATRTLLLKFPDREPDRGYGELAHISQMSQHMDTTVRRYRGNSAERLRRCRGIEKDVILGKIPCVTHGKELRYHSHESLMGKNYVICTLGYSWDRITCFHCT